MYMYIVARVSQHANVASTCRTRSAQQGILLLDPSDLYFRLLATSHWNHENNCHIAQLSFDRIAALPLCLSAVARTASRDRKSSKRGQPKYPVPPLFCSCFLIHGPWKGWTECRRISLHLSGDRMMTKLHFEVCFIMLSVIEISEYC
jgi:hypothetical protein